MPDNIFLHPAFSPASTHSFFLSLPHLSLPLHSRSFDTRHNILTTLPPASLPTHLRWTRGSLGLCSTYIPIFPRIPFLGRLPSISASLPVVLSSIEDLVHQSCRDRLSSDIQPYVVLFAGWLTDLTELLTIALPPLLRLGTLQSFYRRCWELSSLCLFLQLCFG